MKKDGGLFYLSLDLESEFVGSYTAISLDKTDEIWLHSVEELSVKFYDEATTELMDYCGLVTSLSVSSSLSSTSSSSESSC